MRALCFCLVICVCVASYRHLLVGGECANFCTFQQRICILLFRRHVCIDVWDEACVVVSCTVCVLWERLCIQHSFFCAHLNTSTYILSNIITNSPHRSPFPSPLYDLVKHPIISPCYCYAGGVVTSKGSSPSSRPPGQPSG